MEIHEIEIAALERLLKTLLNGRGKATVVAADLRGRGYDFTTLAQLLSEYSAQRYRTAYAVTMRFLDDNRAEFDLEISERR